jgi:hypothetical protein
VREELPDDVSDRLDEGAAEIGQRAGGALPGSVLAAVSAILGGRE